MASKLNSILQIIRDVIIVGMSALFMATSYGKWVNEPAHYILFGVSALWAMLSLINVLLVIIRIKGRGYFYFNTTFQLILLFFVTGLISKSAMNIIALILLCLNIAILVTLRKKGKL